jgi:hypothetical protein
LRKNLCDELFLYYFSKFFENVMLSHVLVTLLSYQYCFPVRLVSGPLIRKPLVYQLFNQELFVSKWYSASLLDLNKKQSKQNARCGGFFSLANIRSITGFYLT